MSDSNEEAHGHTVSDLGGGRNGRAAQIAIVKIFCAVFSKVGYTRYRDSLCVYN